MENNPDGQLLCALDDITEGKSARFQATVDGTPRQLIAIRKGESVYLYINSCPHIGAPLDFKPGQFLNLERTHILCANHGALFDIETGDCISGPCAGEPLTPVKSRIKNGQVFINCSAIN